MARKDLQLQFIDNDHFITWSKDAAFMAHLQEGLLLALHEQGMLTKIQLEKAVEILYSKTRNPQ